MKPLDGARLKVVRAQEHLDSLKTEIDRYRKVNPYQFSVETDSAGTTFDFIPTTIVAPDLHLSCILGDCVTNLRSGLDYIVWQLGLKYCGRPLRPGKDRLYFPITTDVHVFSKKRAPDLSKYNIPAPTISLIESVQPYNAGYSSLADLDAIVNEDKHRLPLFTRGVADESGSLSVEILLADGDVISHEFGHGTRHRIHFPAADSTILPVPPENVKVDSELSGFIAFQNAAMPFAPVDVTLDQIVKTVSNIIPMFEPHV
jgi:hypothetical protein